MSWTPSMHATATAMLDMGCGWADVARAIGVTPDAVRQRFGRNRHVESNECERPYETPPYVANNDGKHLRRIARANRGYGFPVLRIDYRSAA